MNDTLRLVFMATLGFSLLVLYQNWDAYDNPTQSRTRTVQPDAAPTATPTDTPTNGAQQSDDDLPTPTQSLRASGDEESEIPAAAAPATGKIIRVETDWLHAAISEDGGNLVEVKLKKHLQNGEPLPFLQNDERYYVAQSGLVGADDIPNHNSRFHAIGDETFHDIGDHTITLADGRDSLTVTLSAQSGGVRLNKRYIFKRSDYLISVAMDVRTVQDIKTPLLAYFQLAHDGQTPVGYSSLLPTFFGAAMYTERSKFVKISFDDINDTTYPRKSDNGWIGIIQRYFAAVWLAPTGDREFFMRSTDSGVRLGMLVPLGATAENADQTVAARLYAGAQEQDILNALQENGDAPGIGLVVDYGWLTFVAVLLFQMLAFIQSFVNNWGTAIILLTFAVKLLFYPLSSAAYRSMAKMKEEAPRIKQLQEKYSADKQRMQQEMMALYREKKINPLGGCLPILVQIPVFIALYWVLLGSVELRQVPFILWIDDLSSPDPYYVLSLVMGAAMFLQTRLSPAPPDPTQAMVMRIMPIGFALFSIFFPSGLVLYWAVNTLLSIAQQWHISRRIAAASKKR